MQRVLRDTSPTTDDPRALEQAMAIIVRHFPPSVAHVFATPRTGQGGVREWWTELQGQPQRFHDLGEDQQQALLQLYEQRQESVRQLISELQGRGQKADAQVLRRLLGPANLDHLYSVNGYPLVVRWSEPPVKTTPIAPPAPPVAPAAPVAATPRRRRWIFLPWLLLPLLLLLLALAWWFGWPYVQHWWVNRQPAASFVCTTGTQVQAPEFSVILDTSGSMRLSVNATQQDEEWFFQHIDDPGIDKARAQRVTEAPVRMEVAKASLTELINDLHPAIDMRIVTFDGCRAPIDHGLFTPDQRPALIKGVQQLVADDGTALAASLETAASHMDGRNRDGVIVMFADGTDGCGRNVCEVARRIANEQPRLRVNLINISSNSMASCIAESTGGRVYSADSAAQIAAAVREATQEVSSKADCL